LPSIHPELAIIGLNSPFVNAPENFTVSIAEMAALYVTEIQRRQPQGPYSFLGYSVGGIIAYEASRRLLVVGETVERLYTAGLVALTDALLQIPGWVDELRTAYWM
jgi:naphtho-gamma-pyrone polyketide synthase